MTNGKDTAAFYDKFWMKEPYLSKDPNWEDELRVDAIMRFIKRYVLPSFSSGEHLKILDVGCGRGWLTNILSSYGHVLGIDPSITRARELFLQLALWQETEYLYPIFLMTG